MPKVTLIRCYVHILLCNLQLYSLALNSNYCTREKYNFQEHMFICLFCSKKILASLFITGCTVIQPYEQESCAPLRHSHTNVKALTLTY